MNLGKLLNLSEPVSFSIKWSSYIAPEECYSTVTRCIIGQSHTGTLQELSEKGWCPGLPWTKALSTSRL